MANCKHRINIDGHVQEFFSDEELHTFLRDNKRSLTTSLLTDKVVFSLEKSRQDNADDALKLMSDQVIFNKERHEYSVKDAGGVLKDYTPVTKYIADQRLIPEFRLDEIVSNKKAALAKETNLDGTPKYTAEQINTIVKDLVHNWEIHSMLGTSFHEIAEKYWNGELKTAEDVSNFKSELKGMDYALKKYITTLDNLKAKLLKKHGEDAIFRAEVKMYDKEAGVAGTSDLIVIDSDGMAHVYDYKTSDKDELSWHQSKTITIDYQLGIYQQILRRNGIDVGSINYIPVTIRDIDYENKVINDFDMQASKTLYLAGGEKIMLNINRLLPYDFSIKLSEVTSNKNVYDFLKDAFNFEPAANTEPSAIDIDAEFEKLKARVSNNGQSYVLPNAIDPKSPIFIPIRAGEEAIKHSLSSYLKYFNDYQRVLPVKFYDFVTYAKNQIERGERIDWESRWSKQGGTVNKMVTLLTKYIYDPAWRPLQSDALYDLNTVAFENKETNQVDFISLSSGDLDKSPQLLQDKGKATTMLGNYLRDDKAKFEKVPKQVVNGDVELLKLMAFIKNNKEIFENKRIGSLYAVNILKNNIIPKVYTQTLDALSNQWDILMKYVPKDLGIKANDWAVQGIDFTDAFIQDMQTMFERPEFAPLDYRNTKANLDKLTTATTKQEKVEFLNRISSKLLESIEYNPSSGVYRQADQSRLIYLASQAILQLEALPTIREADMKNYANLLKENINTSSPNSIANQAYQNVVKLTAKAMNNTTHRFNQYTIRVREITADLYRAQSSIAQVKIIGNNLGVFKNLFETEDGKPDGRKTMRLKSPDHPTLTPAESKYIREYMQILGEVRAEKLGIEPNALPSEQARNIPLMRASELTAFATANYRDWFKNYFRDIVNPNNIYENDVTSQELLKKQSAMFNFFDQYDLDMEKRDTKLANSDPREFETDLEAVLDMYFMIHAKEQEMNKIMPAINAQKMFTMFSEHYMFEDNATTAKGINDYIATVIFDKNLIAEESKGIAIASQTLKSIVSGMAMIASPVAGVTEFFNGWFNNITRGLANAHDPNLFTKGELFAAGQFVFADVPKNNMSFDKVNLCDNINEMFRVSDMNLKELVHKVQTTSSGVVRFNSHWAYWLQSFPTYTNRMTMFIAQMMHDGILKTTATGGIARDSALQLVKGDMVYNEKLDDRFSQYLSNPDLASHLQTPAWKESRARYLKMKEVLSEEPGGLKADGTLARPYDNATRDSMKTRSDDVHGNYDKETKTRLEQLAFGKILLQFKTYLTAKKNRWYLETTPDDRRGSWEIEYHDGVPISMWKGRINEGIWQTLCALTNEIKVNKGNIIKGWDGMHPSQKQNVTLMLADILQFGLYSLILGLIGYSAMKKKDPVTGEALRGLYNASGDLWIGNSLGAFMGTQNPISVLSWGSHVMDSSWGVLSGKDHAGTDLLNNVAVFRTINKISQ